MARQKEPRNQLAGQRFKMARMRLGLTREQLCEDDGWRETVGVYNVSTIRRWETKGIPERRIGRVAEYFGVDRRLFTDESVSDQDFEEAIADWTPSGQRAGAHGPTSILRGISKKQSIHSARHAKGDDFFIASRSSYQYIVDDVVKGRMKTSHKAKVLLEEVDMGAISDEEVEACIIGLTNTIQLMSDNDEAYFQRAWYKYEQGKWDEAIEDLTAAIRLNSNHRDAYFCRGNLRGSLGEYENALKDFDRVVELDPDLSLGYHYQGECLFFLNREKEAIKKYRQALKLSSPSPETYLRLGIIDLRHKRFKSAISKLNKALKLKPDYAAAYYPRCVCLLEQGEPLKAAEDFREAFRLDPESDPSLYAEPLFSTEKGNYGLAIDAATKAIKLNSDEAWFYFIRGDAKFRMGKTRSAIQDFNKALKLNPVIKEWLRAIGYRFVVDPPSQPEDEA